MKDLKIILNKNSFVKKINNILNNGGVIAFVTDTVWGLGCLPSNQKGVDKIYGIKNRDRSKPLILMSCEEKYLFPYVSEISDKSKELMDKYFPGALTLVLKKSQNTPNFITSNKDTVGIRIPDNEFFKQLCSVIEGHVLATTSANLSGMPASKSYRETISSIGNFVDIVLDDYEYKCKGIESTVVLVENNSFKILRQGAVQLISL